MLAIHGKSFQIKAYLTAALLGILVDDQAIHGQGSKAEGLLSLLQYGEV